MRPEEMSDAIGMIDSDIIEAADKSRKKLRKRKYLWVRWAMAAACICVLVIGILGRVIPVTVEAYAIAEPEYPEMAPYPTDDGEAFSQQYDAWEKGRMAQRSQIKGYEGCLDGFLGVTMERFLTGADGENLVYSPVNLYMALSMLAEITDGSSRQQILDALGVTDIETLREQTSAIWNGSYCKDGTVTSVLANSLWLNENIHYKKAVMKALAKDYYASSYQGEMGTDAYNKELQNWLNVQTGGLLGEQIADAELSEDTVLALVSAIYYQARWNDEFYHTEEDVFYTEDGDITCDFMYQSSNRIYYWGEDFTAVTQELRYSGSMWLILPDEGVTVDDLIADNAFTKLITDSEQWKDQKSLMVNMAMPKFDIASQINLSDGIRSMGITDVFDSTISDFSPMTSDVDGIYLSRAVHGARVTVDEKGCTAAAYTLLEADAGGAWPMEDEVDFVLNRPFLFVITNEYGLPLFAGVVNQPVGE